MRCWGSSDLLQESSNSWRAGDLNEAVICCVAPLPFSVVGSFCSLVCFNIDRITDPLVALLIMNFGNSQGTSGWLEEENRKDEKSRLIHFVVTGTHWLETKISSVLHSRVGEWGGNQPGDKGSEKIPPALHQHSLSRSKYNQMLPRGLEVNTTGCIPELCKKLILQGTELQ